MSFGVRSALGDMMVLWRAWYLQSLATGPVIACDHSIRCTAGVAFASGRFVRMAQRPAANASAVSVSSRHVDIRVETIKQSIQSIHCPNMIWLYWSDLIPGQDGQLLWRVTACTHGAILETDCSGLRMKRNRVQRSSTASTYLAQMLSSVFLYISEFPDNLLGLFSCSDLIIYELRHVSGGQRRTGHFFFSLQSRCMFFCSQMWTLQGMWHMCCRHTLWVDGSQKGRRTWDKAGVSRSGSQCDQSAFIQPGNSGGLVLKMNWLGQDMALIFMFASRALASDTKSIIKQQHS